MADSVDAVLRPVYDELSNIVSALKHLSGQDVCDEEKVRQLPLQLRRLRQVAASRTDLGRLL